MTLTDIILRPGNRGLSGATGDLGLYGGQPDVAVTLGRAPQDAAPLPAADPTQADPPAALPITPPAPAPFMDVADSASASSSDSPVTPPSITAPAAVYDAAADPVARAVDAPTGGSTPPDILAPTVAMSDADGAPSSAPATSGAPAADLTAGQTFALASPAAALATTGVFALDGLVGATLGAIGGIAQPIGPLPGQLVDTIDTLANPVIGAADALADTASDVVGGTLGEVGSLADDALTPVAGIAIDTVTSVADAVGSGIGDVRDTLSPVTDAIGTAEPLAPAAAAVDAIAAPVAVDVGLAGADPDGGVATLVDLVQTSELFVVGQADPAPGVIDTGGSIVDSLIGSGEGMDLLPDDDGSHHLTVDPFDDLHTGS